MIATRRSSSCSRPDATAPTAVRDPAQVRDVHIADSLSALDLEPVARASAIADLGSGAGFPGLVLAVALPNARVSLVEAGSRKCAFLERAVTAMALRNATVVHARAEEWADGIGAHDLVTARAVDTLSVLCEYAAPLLADDGVLVAWKGAARRRRGGRRWPPPQASSAWSWSRFAR